MNDLPDFFGEAVAAAYDDDGDGRFSEVHLALESGFLAELAGEGGRALELAIGTGRVALPLAARGVEVQGIDLSEAMVARLRAKPGGAEIPVEIGDFSTHPRRSQRAISVPLIAGTVAPACEPSPERQRIITSTSLLMLTGSSPMRSGFALWTSSATPAPQ